MSEFERFLEYLASLKTPPVDGTPWQVKEWEEARAELDALKLTPEMLAQKRREFFQRFQKESGMANFDKYLQAFDEGIRADDLTTDQNPYSDQTPHEQLGWWGGKMLAITFAKDFTSAWMQEIANTSAWYWKAHAKGISAHRAGVNLASNPYNPKGWDGFQCPEDGDRVAWNGWHAGWRYGALLNNFQPRSK